MFKTEMKSLQSWFPVLDKQVNVAIDPGRQDLDLWFGSSSILQYGIPFKSRKQEEKVSMNNSVVNETNLTREKINQIHYTNWSTWVVKGNLKTPAQIVLPQQHLTTCHAPEDSNYSIVNVWKF